MGLNISAIIEQRVMSLIKDNPEIEHFMSDLFPDFREKLIDNKFTISELEDLNCQLDNYHSTLYHNLVICIRLAGGVVSFSEKMNCESSYVNEVLRSNCRKTQQTFAKKIVDSKVVSEDFFSSTRIFFPQKFITHFRQKNLTNVFSLSKDYLLMFDTLTELLNKHIPSLDHVLTFIANGEHHEQSAKACRMIELELGLPTGVIDGRPRNFFKKIYSDHV